MDGMASSLLLWHGRLARVSHFFKSKQHGRDARATRSGPALGLQVLRVDVVAGLDRRHDLADVAPVLDDRVADLEVAQGDLVTERNVDRRPGRERLVGREVAPL